MPKVHIVTDSTADLPEGLLEAENLEVTTVPLNVHFGSETFRDKVDISNDEFFRRLASSPAMPTTSQPSAGDFETTYRQLLTPDSSIVSIHISSHLSGTYQSAMLAARALAEEGGQVRVIDSLTASLGLGILARAAAQLARDGATLDEVVRHVEQMVPHMQLMFTVDTLEYLQRGGRIGRAQALLGSLLNVKPILGVENGQVVPVRRERTRTRAVEALVSLAASLPSIRTLGIIHSRVPAEAESLADRLASAITPAIPRDKILISEFGPVIGTHIGPGGIGFVAHEASALMP